MGVSISGALVSMLVSSAVHSGCESEFSEPKDYTIDICSFSYKHTALRKSRIMSQSSEWSDIVYPRTVVSMS